MCNRVASTSDKTASQQSLWCRLRACVPNFCLCCRCWFRWAVPLLIRIGNSRIWASHSTILPTENCGSPMCRYAAPTTAITSTRTRVRWKRGPIPMHRFMISLTGWESVRSNWMYFSTNKTDCKCSTFRFWTLGRAASSFPTVFQRFGAFPMRIPDTFPSTFRSNPKPTFRKATWSPFLPSWKGKFWRLSHANGYSLPMKFRLIFRRCLRR